MTQRQSTPTLTRFPLARGLAGLAGLVVAVATLLPVAAAAATRSEVKRMVVEGAPKAELKDQALGEGMLTLRRVGLLNAIRGVTSVEEVLRITVAD